ncbi:hypothetical protein AGMMS49942_11170 [Spirochaetia bacterium]|nr:hypothetical protein AGMMS49942_11170 [Spirochaetia bacterium]
MPRLGKDLARVLGIPQDKLSSSLLSLIPFFSLPLDTKLIQRLRQEVLSLKLPQKDGGTIDRIRPVALAAVAAAGKGLTLSTEALEKYAAAIAGEEGPDRGDDGNRGGSRHGSGAGHDGAQTPHSEDDLSPEQVRDMAERIEGQSPLLGVLNKIPGKDGRRWINLPFSFSSGGVDYSVSLRVLLADTNAIPWKVDCLALDVATDSRRWSFTLENAGKSGGTLIVRIYPPPKRPAALERTLRELLGMVAEKVILKDMNEGVSR